MNSNFDRIQKKKFSFVSPAEFDKQRNNAIMVSRIFTIMKSDQSKKYTN